MAYRDETDPLKAEESVLARELASLRRREQEVARSLDATRAKLSNRALPLLEDVRIASPCSASWEDMAGDARVRFCGKCAKNVYNLSEMTREEGESLLAKNEGAVCVRLYKRADGTVMTTDCPVGVKRKRVRRVVALAAMAFGAAGTLAVASPHRPMMGGALPPAELPAMGAVAPPTTANPPAPTAVPDSTATPPARPHTLQGTTPAPVHAPRHLMGAPVPQRHGT